MTPPGSVQDRFSFPVKVQLFLFHLIPAFVSGVRVLGPGRAGGGDGSPPGASQDPRGGPTGSAEGKPGRSHGSLRGPREPGLGGNWLGPILRYQPSLGSSKPIRGWPGGSMTRVPCGYCRWVTVLQRRPFWITQPAQGSSPC